MTPTDLWHNGYCARIYDNLTMSIDGVWVMDEKGKVVYPDSATAWNEAKRLIDLMSKRGQ
jgi:hypothetical protein